MRPKGLVMPARKRIFDVTICLLLAIPAAVVVGVASLVVAIDTRANPLFRQRRVGKGGIDFEILKLRTMYVATPNLASHEVGTAAITPSGRLIRRLKIDELPQLVNVLTGDMSLVGPRPCLPNQADVILERARLGVSDLLPGITGPAQIAGIDMSDPKRLALADAGYLRRWSITTDLLLLVKTVRGEGAGDAAITIK